MSLTVVEGPKRRRKVSKSSKKGSRKRKETKRDKCRRWGIPDVVGTGSLRYQNPIEKGIYWWHFSRYVRERDVRAFGRCISCTRPIGFNTCDAGHFIPAHGCGRDLIFDELNVNAECKGCNGFDEMHLLGYAEGLDARHGEGTARALRDRYAAYRDGGVVKDWSRAEYEAKLVELLRLMKWGQ